MSFIIINLIILNTNQPQFTVYCKFVLSNFFMGYEFIDQYI